MNECKLNRAAYPLLYEADDLCKASFQKLQEDDYERAIELLQTAVGTLIRREKERIFSESGVPAGVKLVD